MDCLKRINELRDTKKDLLANFSNIVHYHEVDEEIVYYATKNIENMFEWVIKFFEYANKEDNSSKKALIIGMANTFSTFNIPIVMDWNFDSSIEFLFYSSLEITMPVSVREKVFLMPQVCVCDKYYLDIVVMLKKDKLKDGVEGMPIIGIECDGYKYHYETADKATRTSERIREIKMETGMDIFQYTGKEIYSDCTRLANEFWEYVLKYYL